MSGLAAVTLKSARSEGALQSFVKPADKKITVFVLAALTALCAAAMLFLQPYTGIVVCALSALCFILYRTFAYRNFRGITGDTEGWFLQVTETALLIAVYISEVIAL